ncbi:MAG: hypothetical protein HY957_08700 [Nitrospirae bacterium]|nr:hypothetical protein [Nitrospirota bacterium]
MSGQQEEKKEIMELSHEPVPGYRTAFYIVFLLGVLYLAVIFLKSL